MCARSRWPLDAGETRFRCARENLFRSWTTTWPSVIRLHCDVLLPGHRQESARLFRSDQEDSEARRRLDQFRPVVVSLFRRTRGLYRTALRRNYQNCQILRVRICKGRKGVRNSALKVCLRREVDATVFLLLRVF
ncbi:hypothetical protein L596_028250 [Steinernema carpocapsae]|uniref:Uncharacterized protein n=1 Tax=Steinernema carpocapsae TaxID=34508 RepID=A0A4U5LXX5_STECR|nr:hypothetical protein L596_028250 [Steinernema carpocapsae]